MSRSREEASTLETVPSEPPSRRRRALVVDDQRPLAEALAERLALEGFEARVATTGVEALASFRERGCAVAFVDLRLPDLSGAAVALEIKRRWPGVRVVLMTGMGVGPNDPTVAASRADTLLPKPWRRAELEAILRSLDDAAAETL